MLRAYFRFLLGRYPRGDLRIVFSLFVQYTLIYFYNFILVKSYIKLNLKNHLNTKASNNKPIIAFFRYPETFGYGDFLNFFLMLRLYQNNLNGANVEKIFLIATTPFGTNKVWSIEEKLIYRKLLLNNPKFEILHSEYDFLMSYFTHRLHSNIFGSPFFPYPQNTSYLDKNYRKIVDISNLATSNSYKKIDKFLKDNSIDKFVLIQLRKYNSSKCQDPDRHAHQRWQPYFESRSETNLVLLKDQIDFLIKKGFGIIIASSHQEYQDYKNYFPTGCFFTKNFDFNPLDELLFLIKSNGVISTSFYSALATIFSKPCLMVTKQIWLEEMANLNKPIERFVIPYQWDLSFSKKNISMYKTVKKNFWITESSYTPIIMNYFYDAICREYE